MSDELIASTLNLLKLMSGDQILKVYDLMDECSRAGVDPIELMKGALKAV